MKFNKILLLIITVISNYSIADNIFEPNQLPNIEIIENKNIEIQQKYKNKLSTLQKNRFFVMYSYQNLLQNNIKCQSIEINEYIENLHKKNKTFEHRCSVLQKRKNNNGRKIEHKQKRRNCIERNRYIRRTFESVNYTYT